MKAFIGLGFHLLTFLASSQGLVESNKLGDRRVKMNKLVALIVSSCYQDPYPMVVHDEFDYNLAKLIQTTKSVSTVLSDSLQAFNWGGHRHQHAKEPYFGKVNFIVISNESTKLLDEILQTLRHTPTWNHMAVFIIIDQSSGGCNSNRKLLRLLWNNDIITSYFLCYDEDEKLIIYTYNPFTKRAPAPWRPADTVDNREYDSWTLYYRIYHNQGSKICNNFDFDRTKHFDGYNKSTALLCISEEKLWSTLKNFTKTNIIKQHTFIIDMMKKSLDIDFSTMLYFVNLSSLSAKNEYWDNVPADFFLCPVALWQLEPRLFYFHPILELEAVIVTRFRGLKTPLEIIANYYGFFMISITIIILLITFCVIVISQNQQNYSFAFFEILRLLKNSGVVSSISTIPLRIFFAVIFLYFLVLHATFSGQLSSFLTQSKLRKFPQTLDDLKNSYIKKVYVPYTIKTDHLDPEIKKKLTTSYDLNCQVLFDVKNYNYACISFKQIIINYMERKQLVLSKNHVIRDHFSYTSRRTWPLSQRINEFIMRLEQSNLISYRRDSYVKSVQDNMKRKIVKKLKKYRPIKLKDLSFAFYLLIIGLFAATIAFIHEIMVNKI